jgi:Fe2+ transport system protein FeoA
VRRRYASPAGDVMAIELRGSVLALRQRDLHKIRVRV